MLIGRSHSQLEVIAEDFLSKHGKFDGLSLLIEITIEAYGYYIWPLSKLGQYAEAFVPNKPGIIFVDEEQMMEHPMRFRFTLAEELAHILIHGPTLRGKSVEELQRFNDMLHAKQYRKYEHDAKFLASCLLMRKAPFVRRFHEHCALKRKSMANPLTILRYSMKQLGMDFCVPPFSASQRARGLGLIDEAELISLGY